MASHAAFNNKNAPVYSPTAPNLSEMSPRDISFAVHVDVTPITPQASNVQVVHPPPRHVQISIVTRAAPMTSSNWEVGFFECFSVPAHCCMALIFPRSRGVRQVPRCVGDLLPALCDRRHGALSPSAQIPPHPGLRSRGLLRVALVLVLRGGADVDPYPQGESQASGRHCDAPGVQQRLD